MRGRSEGEAALPSVRERARSVPSQPADEVITESAARREGKAFEDEAQHEPYQNGDRFHRTSSLGIDPVVATL